MEVRLRLLYGHFVKTQLHSLSLSPSLSLSLSPLSPSLQPSPNLSPLQFSLYCVPAKLTSSSGHLRLSGVIGVTVRRTRLTSLRSRVF